MSAEAKYCIGSTPRDHEARVRRLAGGEVRELPEDDDVHGRREDRDEERPRDAEEGLLVADDDVPPDERPEQLAEVPQLADVEVRPARRRLDDEGAVDLGLGSASGRVAGVGASETSSLLVLTGSMLAEAEDRPC